MKYDFENLYKNATMLDRDFLRNEFGYDLGIAEDDILYKNYYNYIVNAVHEKDVYRPCSIDIENWLNKKGDEAKYLFLMAQANQIKYDMDNGRNSMIRGQDGELDLNRDAAEYLRRIGLLRTIRTEGGCKGYGCLEI